MKGPCHLRILAGDEIDNAERVTLKPSFGNLILWKSIYQHEDILCDAIRTGLKLGVLAKVSKYCRRTSPNLDKNSQQMKDIERFRWFSQDYLGFDQDINLVTDVRYSMIPNQIAPMAGWSLMNKRVQMSTPFGGQAAI